LSGKCLGFSQQRIRQIEGRLHIEQYLQLQSSCQARSTAPVSLC
jgi:hypothetical protein